MFDPYDLRPASCGEENERGLASGGGYATGNQNANNDVPKINFYCPCLLIWGRGMHDWAQEVVNIHVYFVAYYKVDMVGISRYIMGSRISLQAGETDPSLADCGAGEQEYHRGE